MTVEEFGGPSSPEFIRRWDKDTPTKPQTKKVESEVKQKVVSVQEASQNIFSASISPEQYMVSLLVEEDVHEERALEAIRGMGDEMRAAFSRLAKINTQLQERVSQLESNFLMSEKIHQQQLKSMIAFTKKQLEVEKAKKLDGVPDVRETWPSAWDRKEGMVSQRDLQFYIEWSSIVRNSAPWEVDTSRITKALKEQEQSMSEYLKKVQAVSNQHADIINEQNERIKRLEALLVERGIGAEEDTE